MISWLYKQDLSLPTSWVNAPTYIPILKYKLCPLLPCIKNAFSLFSKIMMTMNLLPQYQMQPLNWWNIYTLTITWHCLQEMGKISCFKQNTLVVYFNTAGFHGLHWIDWYAFQWWPVLVMYLTRILCFGGSEEEFTFNVSREAAFHRPVLHLYIYLCLFSQGKPFT